MRLFILSATLAMLAAAETLPELKGEYLTGKQAVLPSAAAGKTALVAFGFSYDSRFAVEEWIKHFRADFGSNPKATFYEIPMIGGMGVMGKWFIDRGMRKGTPPADHEHVITVYGGSVGPWRERLKPKTDKEACLVLLDASGTIRWRHNGLFDETAYKELAAQAKALLL